MTCLRNFFAGSAIVFLVVGVLGVALPSFASTDFPVPPGRASNPIAMTLGPDGNLWFAESSNQKIGYTTTSGTITEFPIPNAQSLFGVAKGPDGNIWFTDQTAGFIGRISPTGGNLQTFALPAGTYPQGITAGPDGNLWFVAQRQSGFFDVGKITVGGQITIYQVGLNAGIYTALTLSPALIVPGPDGNLWFVNPQLNDVGTYVVGKVTPSGVVTTYPINDLPFAITAGPDGNLWVVESNHVAKITTSGMETEYQLTISAGVGSITVGPDNNLWFTVNAQVWTATTAGVATKVKGLYPVLYYPEGITTGPDGALWFVGWQTSNVGRITTTKQVTTYPLNAGGLPVWITPGPDGNLWFTQNVTDRVSKITPTGTVTTFSLTQYSDPNGIVSGSDGNLWFTETGSGKIGQMSPAGVLLNEYAAGNGGLFYITSGADGNLWFPVNNDNAIGQMTTGGAFAEFPIPTQNAGASGITKGPDGNVWFTEGAGNVAKIDPSGHITEYPIPNGAQKNLGTIAVGPDKNLWILENTALGALAKFSTTGVLLAEYPVPFQGYPQGLKAGTDGAMWVTQEYPNNLIRMSTTGVVSYVALSTVNAQGNDLAFGPDGKIWVAEAQAGAIGRLSAIGGKAITVFVRRGVLGQGNIATFTDGTPTAQLTDFTATIDWGDGSRSAGQLSGVTGGPFSVSGKHTYRQSGLYRLEVYLHDNVDNSTYQSTPGQARVF